LQLRVIAVGTRMPAWVNEVVADYAARLPADCRPQWREVRAETRTANGSSAVWMQREASRIVEHIPSGAHLVVLDERGRDLDTRALSQRLSAWRERGQVALVIGGPDGLHESLRKQAAETLRLSSLTLAHPLVRVLLAEQLFRAWSILAGHPYHRE
jgi:23S rRNA (pseudouridine1915-N3)-methyltransferase